RRCHHPHHTGGRGAGGFSHPVGLVALVVKRIQCGQSVCRAVDSDLDLAFDDEKDFLGRPVSVGFDSGVASWLEMPYEHFEIIEVRRRDLDLGRLVPESLAGGIREPKYWTFFSIRFIEQVADVESNHTADALEGRHASH